MNIDAEGEREWPDDDKGIQDGVLDERKISFQDGDLKLDAAVEDEKGAANVLQGSGVLQVQQQQPQGTGVCWERFLHVRSIRVLLVENDDSTRHVVTALLRNCNYEVIEAANGLQAWKILEDLTKHIDIVLTELVMPCISGISLLCKIMNHKTRKNIPVIMMSSHDSMGLVFKCLSKGAVDFLVKPVRKNELKNLWQHVWRRCHSSSGSGSESGTQTQKSVKSKNSEKADNSGSDDGENNGSNGLNAGDGSDDGSGAQSSWTKQAVEVDSSPALSPIDQVAECPDSTCAQVIRPHAENSGNKREGHEQSQPDVVVKGKNLDTVLPRNVESKSENAMEIPRTPMGAKLKSLSELDCNMSNKQVDKGQMNAIGEYVFNKNKVGAAKTAIPLIDRTESGSAREVTSILDVNSNAADDSKEPNFELSLKRFRGVQDTGRSFQDDRCVLRRSEQSAFSRYNTSSNVFKAPNGVTGSSSVVDNSEVAKRESVGDIHAHSTDHLVYQSSNGLSTNIDMGSTTNKLRPHPSLMKDKSETTTTVNGLHSSAFRPVKNDIRYTQPQVGLILPDDINMQTTDVAPARGSHQEFAQREAALNKFRQKRKERCFKKKVRYQNRKKLAEQRPRVRGQFVKQTGTDSSNRSSDE
ncbi:hypothetical protein CDL12_19391 [Handroanthus impetiginosus]|uniref:Two-component response regulator-like APRR7 n=1 Tax=Handroanthus impetiginosus TaxID=429701 RepID=A0A2G9GS04_9LAMI|nr:hypothetical protein CDL12_19391 [Handroanthus impetiginosus]